MEEYLFSIGTWLPITGETRTRFAFGELKAGKAAVLSTNREWSLRVGRDFARHFLDAGEKVVFEDAYSPGTTDFRTRFAMFGQRKPDVLYALVNDNLGTFFKQLRESGVDVPIIQSDNLNQEWIDTLGEVLEGVYHSQSMEPENEQANEMVKSYREKFDREPTQLLFHAWDYDGLRLIAHAAESHGASRVHMKEGLYEAVHFPGVIGPMSITREGSHRVGVRMFRIAEGAFELLDWPKE